LRNSNAVLWLEQTRAGQAGRREREVEGEKEGHAGHPIGYCGDIGFHSGMGTIEGL
jgi:hypothetical protein